MPQLIMVLVVIGLIYLYFVATFWVLGNFGPPIVLFTSVVLTVGVLVVHARHAVQVYDRPGLRRLMLVLAGALYVQIALDLVWIVARSAAEFTGFPLAHELEGGLVPAVFGSPVQSTVVDVLRRFLPSGLPAQIVVAGAALVVAVAVVPALVLARGLSGTRKGDDQPAYLGYFEEEWAEDERIVREGVTAELMRLGKRITDGVSAAMTGAGCIVWPIALPLAAGLVVPAALGVVVVISMSTAFWVGTRAAWLVERYAGLALLTTEQAVMRIRSGHAKCPHAGCHKPIPNPTVLCPTCGARHDRLVPGKYGVLTRRCACGATLPHLFLLGKARQAHTRCPSCDGEIVEELFAENVHVPVYGAPSSGKSMWMSGVLHALLVRGAPTWAARLIQRDQQDTWEHEWRPALEGGRVRSKTTRNAPDALLLSVRRHGGLPVSVYLYDPAGESLQARDGMASHQFLRFVDGIVLAIDPLSLEPLAAAWRNATGERTLPPSTATDPILEIVQRSVNEIARRTGTKRLNQLPLRVAVMLTKMDQPGLLSALGLVAVPSDGDAQAAGGVIRGWFEKNERPLVQLLEGRFREVAWFVSSVQGIGPGGSFDPAGAFTPLRWILEGRASLAAVGYGRVTRRGAEVAIGIGVLGAFALPVAISAWWIAVAIVLP